MGIKELARYIGREYLLTVESFTIRVMVDNVKMAYGNARAYVCPVGGDGYAWVSLDRLMELEG